MKYLFHFLLLGLLTAACVSEKKAQNQAFAFYQQHPLALAVHCLEKFPLQKQYVAGKTVFRVDTVYAQPTGLSPLHEKKPTTIIRYISRVDTIYEESTVKIALCQAENNDLKAQLAHSTQTEKQAAALSLKRLWLLILMSVLCFLQFFVSIKRFFSSFF